ncbi:MAG: diguanylate cyclase [Deltaproteobacteria bacterium]|nr:diguanylate cyclase [Deltaproteobacteria bacterium]
MTVQEQNLNQDPVLLEECVSLLIQSPYFHTMGRDVLQGVLAQGVWMSVPKGHTIIREGQVDEDIYFLLEGSLAVRSDGKFIIRINTLGSVIGELSLISSKPRSADVVTERPAQLIRISSLVVKSINEKPIQAAHLLSAFAHIMTAKLQETSLRAKLYEDAVRQAQELSSSKMRLEGEVTERLNEVLLYSKVVETSRNYVLITDPVGIVQRINPAANHFFNSVSKNPLGRRLSELFKEFDMGDFARHKLGEGWEGEWVFRGTDDHPIYFYTTVSPILGTDGELLAVALLLNDISLQKAQEQAITTKNEEIRKALMDLEATYQELQRSDKLKMESLTVISDELSSPIRKIVSNVNKLIERDTLRHDNIAQQHLEVIQEQAGYLKSITENINHLIDLQVNHAASTQTQLNLGDLVTDVLKETRARATKKGVPIEVEFPKKPLLLVGDPDRFRVMFNLLFEQAIVAAQPGIPLKIRGSLMEKAQQIHLEISYIGPALTSVGRDSSEDGKMGILIGLPLARKVISQYQGSLQFLRDRNHTRVSILLPRTQKEGEDRPNRVLILDQQDMDRLIIRGVIEHLWHDAVLLETDDPFEFLENYEDFRPDLVVMDPKLDEPGWGNHRLVASLVADRRHVCPVLAVSSLYTDFAERTIAAERGVSDFLAKPYSIFDIRFKVSSLIQSHRRQESLHQNMDQAQKQAFTDGLTKLANRKNFDGFLETQVNYSRQTHKPCSLIMLDIDNFKHYNDTNGHQLGDEVLRGVARVLNHAVRASDLAARYGGEEFVVVLPETAKDMAVVIAEKVRRTLMETPFPNGEKQPLGMVSASFGVATFNEDAETGEGLLQAADKCLYIAKEQGRNNVVKAPGLFKSAPSNRRKADRREDESREEDERKKSDEKALAK